MARPEKQGLDYFSHDCRLDEKLNAIIDKHGNNAYVVWFRFLELAYQRADGVLDLTNEVDREDFARLCRVDIQELSNIVQSCQARQLLTFMDNVAWRLTGHGIQKRLAHILTEREYQRGAKQAQRNREKGLSTNVQTLSTDVQHKVKETKLKEKESITTPLWRDCQRVRLTPERYATLKEKYPDVDHYIEAIDAYCLSKGKTYKDYGAAVVSWVLADVKAGKRETEPYDWRKDPTCPPLK